jgi:hypothetical protein
VGDEDSTYLSTKICTDTLVNLWCTLGPTLILEVMFDSIFSFLYVTDGSFFFTKTRYSFIQIDRVHHI